MKLPNLSRRLFPAVNTAPDVVGAEALHADITLATLGAGEGALPGVGPLVVQQATRLGEDTSTELAITSFWYRQVVLILLLVLVLVLVLFVVIVLSQVLLETAMKERL